MMNENPCIKIGCVADDFTGASDAASFLVKSGLRTLLFNGVPEDAASAEGCEAVVVALKSRSTPADEAVRDTLAALRWLRGHGARQFYLKYCSTFDCTPKGNIGPTVDAALEELGERYTLLCPSLPVNGRTVRDGKLYVNGVPLHESPMKDHPLNPMWDCELSALMAPQGKYPCLVLDAAAMSRPKAEILAAVEAFGAGKEHFYVVPDYETDADGARVAEVFGGLGLLTGGSGLLEFLGGPVSGRADGDFDPSAGTEGPGIVVSGSCSKATRGQIAAFKAAGGRSLAVDPADLLHGRQTVDGIWDFVRAIPDEPVLVYSAGAENPALRERESGADVAQLSGLLEGALAETARRAVAAGYTRVISAGGETSGAVTLALGFNAFFIGESIAPGVPMMTPAARRDVRLVLKSGNFGQEDFFMRALGRTKRG